ncbi:MAG TPA: hypothetical protein VGJ26_01080, partial [Pirellulales bacterium]
EISINVKPFRRAVRMAHLTRVLINEWLAVCPLVRCDARLNLLDLAANTRQQHHFSPKQNTGEHHSDNGHNNRHLD